MHFKQLQKKLIEEETALLQMSKVLKKEHKDVAELEGKSLKAVYYKFLGDRHIRLEKENDDYQRALTRFSELYKSVELLRFEFKLMSPKVKDPNDIKERLDILIIEREKELFLSDPVVSPVLKAMIDEIHNLDLLVKNLNQSYTHIKKLIAFLKKMEAHFQQANSTHVNLMYNDIQYLRKNIEKGKNLYGIFLQGIESLYSNLSPKPAFLYNDYKRYFARFFERDIKTFTGNTRINDILEGIIFIRDLLIKTITQIKLEIRTSKSKIKKMQKNKRKLVLKS